jgi:DnaJ-class molecular chaperone
MTKAAELIEKQAELLRHEAQILEDRICSDCDGEGEVIAKEKINCRSIDVPTKVCPECGGSGTK